MGEETEQELYEELLPQVTSRGEYSVGLCRVTVCSQHVCVYLLFSFLVCFTGPQHLWLLCFCYSIMLWRSVLIDGAHSLATVIME